MRWCVGIGAIVWVGWIVGCEIGEILDAEDRRWEVFPIVLSLASVLVVWAAVQLLRKRRMALAVKLIAGFASVNGVIMGPGIVLWALFPDGPPEWTDSMATILVATIIGVAFYLVVVSWTLLPRGTRLGGSRMLVGVTVCWIFGLEAGILFSEVIRELYTSDENPYGRSPSPVSGFAVLGAVGVGFLCRRIFRAPAPSWNLRQRRRKGERAGG